MKLAKYVIVALCAFGLAAPAWAEFAQGNKVTFNEEPIFSIAGSAGGYSPEHRAWLAQDALDTALVLASDRSPSAVRVERLNGAIVVTLDGRKVATADAASASLEGTTAEGLAGSWAAAISRCLADSAKTNTYLADLTGQNPINARVAILERRIYAPPGTVLPVAFSTTLSSETVKAGDVIVGTLTKDVTFGNYVIPAGSTVTGLVAEETPGAFTIAFNTLQLPDGVTVPIVATLTSDFLGGDLGPHPVCTVSLPYGIIPIASASVTRETSCRIPATIGIGTVGGGAGERLVLRRGTHLVIAAGTPVAAIFGSPTQVAVVLKEHAM
jgi:hypothetical protein